MIISKGNIRAEISGAEAVAYAHNKNPIVQVGPNTKLLWYDPPFRQDKNGAMVNIAGSNRRRVDQNDLLKFGPVSLNAGDVVSITKSADNPNYRLIDWPKTRYESRSAVDEAMAVAFVSYKPVEGQLFPPPIGESSNPIVSFFRSNPILPERVNLDKLATKFDLGSVSDDATDWNEVKRAFSDYWMEAYDGWNTDTFTPAYQHPGYGRNVAYYGSRAQLYLNSKVTQEEKRDLALSIVEQGLAQAMAFASGRKHQANGGHMQGRKHLLITAGHLLDIPQMANPNWIGRVFQEDNMHYFSDSKWWWGDWNVFWQKANEFPTPLEKHPNKWSDTDKFLMQGYYWHACGSNIGTAMGMKAMGLEDSIGKAFVQGIRQFMTGPNEEAKKALEDVGCIVPWGSDYPHDPGQGKGIQKKLYTIYGL